MIEGEVALKAERVTIIEMRPTAKGAPKGKDREGVRKVKGALLEPHWASDFSCGHCCSLVWHDNIRYRVATMKQEYCPCCGHLV